MNIYPENKEKSGIIIIKFKPNLTKQEINRVIHKMLLDNEAYVRGLKYYEFKSNIPTSISSEGD